MFLAIFVLALVLVSIFVVHDPFSVILSISELPCIPAISLLCVLSLTTELSSLPVSIIDISIFSISHVSITMLEILLPVTIVSTMGSYLLTMTILHVILKLTYIMTLLLHLLRIPLASFKNLFLPLSLSLAIYKRSLVDYSLEVPKVALSIKLSLLEIPLILSSILFIQKLHPPFPLRSLVDHLSVVVDLPARRSNLHELISS